MQQLTVFNTEPCMSPFADAVFSTEARQIFFQLVIGHVTLGDSYFYQPFCFFTVAQVPQNIFVLITITCGY